MAIDPRKLAAQRAVFGAAVSAAPRAVAHQSGGKGGPRMSDKTCPRCRLRKLAVHNRRGICGTCWNAMGDTKNRAIFAATGKFVRGPRRASEATINKARAALAARGIHVEAA